jgi:hypothetical protein
MSEVGGVEGLTGDVAISALVLIGVEIAQSDIDTKGRQSAAHRAVAPARIEGDSWQTDAQP